MKEGIRRKQHNSKLGPRRQDSKLVMGKILLLKISRAKTETVQGIRTNMGCLGPALAVELLGMLGQ